jgi:hypothetical protein
VFAPPAAVAVAGVGVVAVVVSGMLEMASAELDVELDVELEEDKADVRSAKTMTDEALSSHFAQGCGFGGKTSKRATPVSQQTPWPPSQQ